MESILDSVKKMLGIDDEDVHFDGEIIIYINGALMFLNQLGIGQNLYISDRIKTWSELLGDRTDLEAVKQYVYLRVRLIFDPPATGFATDAIERQIRELEWRINVQAEGVETDGGQDEDDQECD
jgi:hypothetical protein